MRLSAIKLAGFKSFVDPTNLQLPTNMTAVVGPNGCGKSNIIDAIRWVMGESAASRLRGDLLTDVIFNGSSGRKPVSQATVELIFDNSDAFIAGEFAAFSEISVKRLVSRDGQSQYFLNGARCRKRDITDLFLGTGLGPRSYAIIEQGMVSQLVESAPDDLRVHLEEAAGISKYKERRKETETRIKATRENLDRVKDVRDEVDKQLVNLERQAKQAEKYTELKAQKARVEAELAALSWQRLDLDRKQAQAKLDGFETELARLAAERTHIETSDDAARLAHEAAADAFSAIQAESYRIGGEIARLEQELKYRKDLTDRSQRELSETERNQAHFGEQLDADVRQLKILEETLEIDEPTLESLQDVAEGDTDRLKQAESAQLDWQRRFAEHAQVSASAIKQTEVERARIELLERQSVDKLKRREILQAEQALFNLDVLHAEFSTIEAEVELMQGQLEQLTEALDQRKQALTQGQSQQSALQNSLRQAEQQHSAALARLASLEALQHAALGQDQKEIARWLAERGLTDAPRLGSLIEVEPGFERAIEAVLGDLLEAVVVTAPHTVAPEQLPGGVLALFASQVLTDAEFAALPSESLAAKVRGPRALHDWLFGIRFADSISDARAQLDGLAPGAAIVSLDGHYLSSNWSKLKGNGVAHDGVLARAREIVSLKDRIDTLDEQVDTLKDQLQASKSAQEQAERARDEAQTQTHAQHRKLNEQLGRQNSQRGRLEQTKNRADRVTFELGSLVEQLGQEDDQTHSARARLEEGLELMAQYEDERLALDAERTRVLSGLESARLSAREARERAHQLELSVQAKRSAKNSLTQAIARIRTQLEALVVKQSNLQTQLEQAHAPIEALSEHLQSALEQRVIVDKRIAEARAKVDDCVEALRRLDTDRQKTEILLERTRESRNQLLLSAQAISIREEQFQIAIQQSGFAQEDLLQSLPENANAAEWEATIADLEAKIRRLEPVNLAAIQELAEASTRKTYLDAQLEDLNTALETLEEAIKKIDRETKARFKQTFDQVNIGFQALFPRLFGGGDARLELTGEDLLETGVNIIARPPGKRPSSIGLLSGGEKALTAVALIFAIFQLNPAPFCLLDEVDAPLDEANVGRFSKLVEEMSKTVQFVFVTHNKVTMEHARQLAGVTMREPGVSRLVAVDLAEASKLIDG